MTESNARSRQRMRSVCCPGFTCSTGSCRLWSFRCYFCCWLLQWPPCMDEATKPQYLVSRSGQSGPVRLGYPTAAAALTKASELLEQGHLDVRICTPQGRIFVSDEFDQLDG